MVTIKKRNKPKIMRWHVNVLNNKSARTPIIIIILLLLRSYMLSKFYYSKLTCLSESCCYYRPQNNMSFLVLPARLCFYQETANFIETSRPYQEIGIYIFKKTSWIFIHQTNIFLLPFALLDDFKYFEKKNCNT